MRKSLCFWQFKHLKCKEIGSKSSEFDVLPTIGCASVSTFQRKPSKSTEFGAKCDHKVSKSNLSTDSTPGLDFEVWTHRRAGVCPFQHSFENRSKICPQIIGVRIVLQKSLSSKVLKPFCLRPIKQLKTAASPWKTCRRTQSPISKRASNTSEHSSTITMASSLGVRMCRN